MHRRVVAVALSLGCAVAGAQSSDAEKSLAQTGVARQVAARPSIGDPITLGTMRPSYEADDFVVRGTVGDLRFTRHFTDTPAMWEWDIQANQDPLGPFGTSTCYNNSECKTVYWWHSLYGYVELVYPRYTPEPWDFEGYIRLRLPSGQSIKYIYDAGSGAFKQPQDTYSDIKLYKDSYGFVAYVKGDGRYYFRQSVYSAQGATTTSKDTYYLSWIEDEQYPLNGIRSAQAVQDA